MKKINLKSILKKTIKKKKKKKVKKKFKTHKDFGSKTRNCENQKTRNRKKRI